MGNDILIVVCKSSMGNIEDSIKIKRHLNAPKILIAQCGFIEDCEWDTIHIDSLDDNTIYFKLVQWLRVEEFENKAFYERVVCVRGGITIDDSSANLEVYDRLLIANVDSEASFLGKGLTAITYDFFVCTSLAFKIIFNYSNGRMIDGIYRSCNFMRYQPPHVLGIHLQMSNIYLVTCESRGIAIGN